MSPESLRIIHEEHAALSAMLQSLRMMIKRGPDDGQASYFDVVRAMLFYIDEFPERLHHPKESAHLFPPVLRAAPYLQDTVDRLDRDHERGERLVRELQHLLLAWELLGDARRAEFEAAALRFVDFYLEHMHIEEQIILPEALKLLPAEAWQTIDAAFTQHGDPLTDRQARDDPMFDRLFSRIVMRAPSPIGLGQSG